MTYSVGGLIQAADYNGFVGPASSGGTGGANLNDFWNVGSASLGWGQTVVANPSTGNTVTATQWATLVNNLATAGNHTGVAITARSAPVAGNTINILAALNTDLTNLTNSRGNAAASGTEVGTFSGTTSKTTKSQKTWIRNTSSATNMLCLQEHLWKTESKPHPSLTKYSYVF
jgi:hypothetical protein